MDGVEICLLKQTIHPFPVSVKFDGMTDINSLYGLHPQREMAVSDGDFVRKRPKRLHPTKEKAVSDGGSGQKCLNRPHPHRNKSLSDGDFWQKRPNGPNRRFPCSEGRRIITQEEQCPVTRGAVSRYTRGSPHYTKAVHVTQRRYYEILHSRDRWSGEGSGKREW